MDVGLDIPQQAFVLRLNERLPAAKQGGVVGVGWCDARDLDKLHDWESFKLILKNAGYGDSERALGNAAGSLWRFFVTMRKGDILVIPSPDSGFYLASVEGNVFYDEAGRSSDFAWKRPVRWLNDQPIPRSFARNELQMRMKARQTCVDATDLLMEIRETQQRKTPIDFGDEVLQGAYASVVKALLSALTDRGLEELVRKLAEANGAHSIVLAKNSGRKGDADVLATYDLRIGKQDAKIRVAYQIKQHWNESDSVGIQQLLERMEDSLGEIDRGCFVTTAKEISKEASDLAEKNGIIVLKEKELVEWILMTGLGAFTG